MAVGIGPLPGVSGFSSVIIADRTVVAGGIATCHAVTVESVAARETFLGISGFAALGTGVNPVGFVGVVTPEVRICWRPFRSGFGERKHHPLAVLSGLLSLWGLRWFRHQLATSLRLAPAKGLSQGSGREVRVLGAHGPLRRAPGPSANASCHPGSGGT